MSPDPARPWCHAFGCDLKAVKEAAFPHAPSRWLPYCGFHGSCAKTIHGAEIRELDVPVETKGDSA